MIRMPHASAVGLALVLCGTAWAQPSGTQVVSLRNGSLLQGKVETTPEGLVVSKGPWYSVRVPQRDVDFIADDLTATYRIRLRRLRPDDFDGHLHLAQWCLRYDLDRFAADQLLYLVELRPGSPAVEALEHQLKRRANPPIATGVRTASYETPVPESTDEDIDLGPLAPGTVPEYTRFVQPLLLNRCGQATCHGKAASNPFQLSRGPGRGLTRRDVTWRNLREVLSEIDRSDPANSPLVTQATTAHGNSPRAPFEPHEFPQRERLIKWVNLVVGIDDEPEWTEPTEPMSAYDAEASFPIDHGTPLPTEVDSSRPEGTKGAAGMIDEPASADPFSPDAFNARFHGEP